jgi:hypothetical protein
VRKPQILIPGACSISRLGSHDKPESYLYEGSVSDEEAHQAQGDHTFEHLYDLMPPVSLAACRTSGPANTVIDAAAVSSCGE